MHYDECVCLCLHKPPTFPGPVFLPSHGGLSHSRSSSRGSLEEAVPPQPRLKELPVGVKLKVLDYSVYMAQYVSSGATSRPASPSPSAASSPGGSKKVSRTFLCLKLA